MFTVLPRQMFGLVQSKLFPKYFLSGTFCSGIALATYAGHHPYRHWHGDYKMQVNLFKWLSHVIICFLCTGICQYLLHILECKSIFCVEGAYSS